MLHVDGQARRRLVRALRGTSLAAYWFGGGFLGHALITGGPAVEFFVGFLLAAQATVGIVGFRMVERGAVEDGVSVTVLNLFVGSVLFAFALPGAAVVNGLFCIMIAALALQYLDGARLRLALLASISGVVWAVIARQTWIPNTKPKNLKGIPLPVLDAAEILGALAMATVLAVLLYQARARLVGTIGDLREALQHERELRDEKAELVVARRLAEEQGQARAQFLANMSHEIRTPLNAVIGLAGLLEDSDLEDEAAEHARMIRASGDHLLTLVNDILDFSRIDAGHVVLQETEMDLLQVVQDAVDAVAVAASAKGLALGWEAMPEVPGVVVGDPGRIRQVVLNLLANAVKFTEAGAVTVTVSVVGEQPVEGEPATLQVRVSDTGRGIPTDDLERIFAPFEQADDSSTRAAGGAGLGLAISREIAEHAGGRLFAHSRLGRGSTFVLELPLRVVALVAIVDADARRAAYSPGFDPGMAARLPRRILLVEDHRANQIVVQRMLERMGYRADVAATGTEAIEALERQPYDVVFMDMHMPDMDGLAATRAIRSRWPEERQPHIVAFTAAAFAEDRRRCLEAGMDDFITKPATSVMVTAALERSRIRSAADAT